MGPSRSGAGKLNYNVVLCACDLVVLYGVTSKSRRQCIAVSTLLLVRFMSGTCCLCLRSCISIYADTLSLLWYVGVTRSKLYLPVKFPDSDLPGVFVR
jgi:hypothetical protein